MWRRLVAGLFVFLVAGCGSPSARDESVSLDQVPSNLQKIANEKLPNVKFERATKRADGSYEIRGKDKTGKVRDIDLRGNGEVLEIE
jgi:hypothetical protein